MSETERSAPVIRSITAEEWATVGKLSPEAAAALALQPGTGIAIPCRWSHYKSAGRNACGGSSLMHTAARRHKMKLACCCKAGTLYVWRYPVVQ